MYITHLYISILYVDPGLTTAILFLFELALTCLPVMTAIRF